MNLPFLSLFKHILIYVVIGGTAVAFMQFNIGRQADLAQEVGQYQQMVEQETLAKMQLAQELEDQEAKAALLAEQAKTAMAAVEYRMAAHKEALTIAKRVTDENARLRRQNAELQSWANVNHPDAVRGMLESASSTAAKGHSKD